MKPGLKPGVNQMKMKRADWGVVVILVTAVLGALVLIFGAYWLAPLNVKICQDYGKNKIICYEAYQFRWEKQK